MTSAVLNADPAPPLPFDDDIEPYRVDGRDAVRSVLSELVAGRASVGLFLPDASRPLVEATLAAVDDDGITFVLSSHSVSRADLLVEAPRTLASSAPGAVRYQFMLNQIRTVSPAERLVAPLPDSVWRVQRRQAFRVTPPASDRATIHLTLAGSPGEVTLEVVDLSVTGLCVELPSSIANPLVGEFWTGARLEVVDQAPIPCTLSVIRITRGEDANTSRVSCAFVSLSPEAARRIQVYVLSIERRENNRLMRLSD